MTTIYRFVILTLLFALCSADIDDCEFEDTIELKDPKVLENGSLLYKNVVFSLEEVDVYDYEELYNGVRVYKEEHFRGCLCKKRNCIKFCCEPNKEDYIPNTRECEAIEDLNMDMSLTVRYANGSRGKAHATRDFTVLQGIPCESDVILDAENNVLFKWEILEDGSLYKVAEHLTVSKRDYCLLPDETKSKDRLELVPLECAKYMPVSTAEIINDISKAISVPFIVLTLFIYAIIPELRNLHGKCFMSYLSSLDVYYTIYSIREFMEEDIYETIGCSIMGYLGYFCALGVFFWLNVISFDLWQSFRRSVPFRSSQTKRFLAYSAYAWGVPLCFMLILLGLDNSNVKRYYKPGVAEGCWIDTYKWPAVGYYTGVNLAIVLVDIVFLSLTFYTIITAQRDIKRIIANGDSKRNDKMNQDKNSFALFLRLFLVMGITWIFEAFEIIETLINPGHNNPLYYVTDFLNAIIGVLIFICFVLNKKVLGLIKKRIQRSRRTVESSAKETETMLRLSNTQRTSATRRN